MMRPSVVKPMPAGAPRPGSAKGGRASLSAPKPLSPARPKSATGLRPSPTPSDASGASAPPGPSSAGPPSSDETANVKVVARIRPLNDLERTQREHEVCVQTAIDGKSLKVLPPAQGFIKHTSNFDYGKTEFAFDGVFGMEASQEEVYNQVGYPILKEILNGYNGTIFTYGQTGSGKTYTMQGPGNRGSTAGLMPRLAYGLFEAIEAAGASVEFAIKVCYVEIYMERIRDLLDGTGQLDNLPIREDKYRKIWVIEGATSRYVASAEELLQLIDVGSANRVMGETVMNEQSSRSHCIFMITVQQQSLTDGRSRTGKLYLVDLAGSEKVEKSKAEGMRFEETKLINKSLTTLGMVINALTDGKSTHVPYRDSKLTRVLEESLGGNARTALMICCSPSSWNIAETLSTLRFGARAKNIKNRPRVNLELSVDELKQLLQRAQGEIASLNKRLKHLENENKVLRGQDPTLLREIQSQRAAAAAASQSQEGEGGEGGAPPLRSVESRLATIDEQMAEMVHLATLMAQRRGDVADVRTITELHELMREKLVRQEHELRFQRQEIGRLQGERDASEERLTALQEENDNLTYLLAKAGTPSPGRPAPLPVAEANGGQMASGLGSGPASPQLQGVNGVGGAFQRVDALRTSTVIKRVGGLVGGLGFTSPRGHEPHGPPHLALE